jgi:hypothetical protein
MFRPIVRQRSGITFLAEGDANTRYFHLEACHRGRKKRIDQLEHQGMHIVNDLRAQVFFQHFDGILGSQVHRSSLLNFDVLWLQSISHASLDFCFSERVIWNVIKAMPPDKAPRPDGFTGRFYQVSWPIIKGDVVRAFNAFWLLDSRSFHLVNQAFMVLLRKKKDACHVTDFRPISLIHNVSKLIAKVLSARLAPHMLQLVQPNQSMFIRGRMIHDNFRAVQLKAKLLHARKRASILLKVDIVKAFDTVIWTFLLDLLHHMRFSRRWINWISVLLSILSTKILLSGQEGNRICHARGLRQGYFLCWSWKF